MKTGKFFREVVVDENDVDLWPIFFLNHYLDESLQILIEHYGFPRRLAAHSNHMRLLVENEIAEERQISLFPGPIHLLPSILTF